jgi:hypothetical protein
VVVFGDGHWSNPEWEQKLVTLCKGGSIELILLFDDGNVLSQFSHFCVWGGLN